MDGRVYTPGAGHVPPLLAGREEALTDWALVLNDVVAVGRAGAEDTMLLGPRGVGKTVLMTAMSAAATRAGFEVIPMQAARGQSSIVDLLVHHAAERLTRAGGPWRRAKGAFDRLAGISIGVAPVTASMTVHAPLDHSGRHDPGVLAQALATLAREVRGDTGRGGVMLTLDEMQVARADDLALLAAALHRLNVQHPEVPVLFAGTGLPHTPQVLAQAGVTHPDRLFTRLDVPLRLDRAGAAAALIQPAQDHHVTWHPDAVDLVVRASNGYPAHLQEMAHRTWQAAPGPHAITADDARRGVDLAARRITRRSLGPRWEATPPRQMEYLAAVAVHGGAATTRQLEATLGRRQRDLSWIRDRLIHEGDIYAPQRGHVQITVPLSVPFILAQYPASREMVDEPDKLTSLDTMRHRAHATPGPAPTTGTLDQTHQPPEHLSGQHHRGADSPGPTTS